MGADKPVDFFDEIGGGIEGATADGALSDEGEEAFDLVEPRGIGRREVNVPTRPAAEPSFGGGDLRLAVASFRVRVRRVAALFSKYRVGEANQLG